MRLCASLLRGVAAPLGCVIFLFLTKLRFSHPVLRAFRVCETWEVSLPSERSTRFGNPAWPGGRTANFAAFGAWSGAPKERREPSGQRCAYARRCSEASRPRWAALLCLQFGDVAVFSLCVQYFLNVQGGRALSLPSACSACC